METPSFKSSRDNKFLFWEIRFFLFLSVASYLFFASFHLSQFSTADEHLWIFQRIPRYWEALGNGDWEKTQINDKPGVTLAIISGAGLLFEKTPKNLIRANDLNPLSPESANRERLNFVFRLPLILFNGLAAFYFFWVLKKLFKNEWRALWCTILVLFSPILIGISQVINPDALLWTFSTGALLSFFAFLETEEKKFVAFAAIALGCALATKYTAVILFPFLFIILSAAVLIREIPKPTHNYIKHAAIGYLSAFFGAFGIFSLLMPAAIQHPSRMFLGALGFRSTYAIFAFILIAVFLLLIDAILFKSRWMHKLKRLLDKFKIAMAGEKIIGLILIIVFAVVAINWKTGQSLIKYNDIPLNAKYDHAFEDLTGFHKIIFEFFPFVFSLQPYILALLLFLWLKVILKPSHRQSWITTIFSLLLPIYFSSMIVAHVISSVRYSIILYPIAMILAGIALFEFSELPLLRSFNKLWITAALFSVSIFSLWTIKPFYFNYTSPILPSKYVVNENWGYGGYEAAQYLNSLPNAKNLYVWSDYYGFCEFFSGNCVTKYTFRQDLYPIDYFVLTQRGKDRYLSSFKKSDKNKPKDGSTMIDVRSYYKNNRPEWELLINGRAKSFVRVLKK